MKKKYVGLAIFVLLIVIIVAIKLSQGGDPELEEMIPELSNMKTVTVATGGGKEDFLADERVKQIMKEKYL